MEYGKFNSAEELLKGYNELQKSFTRKCQELSELRNVFNCNTESTLQDKATTQLPELRQELNSNTENAMQTEITTQSPELRNAVKSNTESDLQADVTAQLPLSEQSPTVVTVNANPPCIDTDNADTNAVPNADGTADLSNHTTSAFLSEANNVTDLNETNITTSGTNVDTSPPSNQPSTAIEEVDRAVPADNEAQSAPNDDELLQFTTFEQVRQYLATHPLERSLLQNEQDGEQDSKRTLPKVINGGNVSLIPPTRPRTIKEASVLAKELFKN
ncbi:MAG: hypothetical protein K2M64_01255 [Clostridia bacterium]|nr:hypothetical protein [Clostridia bacterium]